MLGVSVKRRVLSRLLVPVAVLGLAATACAPQDDDKASSSTTSASSSTSASTDQCAKDQLKTVTPGKLTLATDKPVFEPWFVDDKPENAKGFEGAVAAAVAQKMGFETSEVTWVRQPFDAAIQP